MRPLVQIHLYCDPIFSSEASGQQQTGVRVYALEKFLRRAAFGRLCLKSRLRIPRQKSTHLRLKSEFWAEGSGLGFHVATCKTGVFTHQYSSVLGKPTFSTQPAKKGASRMPPGNQGRFRGA